MPNCDDDEETKEEEGEVEKDGKDKEEEYLRVWLGGLSPFDITPSAWELEEVAETNGVDPSLDSRPARPSAFCPQIPSVSPVQLQPQQKHAPLFLPSKAEYSLSSDMLSAESSSPWFCLAYAQHPGSGQPKPPSVSVVDLSMQGRGNALVATQRIKAGQVIYTERAAVATQMPTTARAQGDESQLQQQVVRACQYCFRSLEPISSCRSRRPLVDNETAPLLPLPELWPVPEMEPLEPFPRESESDRHDKLRRDKHGRVQCQTCQFWFCCLQCHSTLESQFDSCCLLHRAIQRVTELYSTAHTNDIIDSLNDTVETADMQPAIPLAVRMFALLLRGHRTSNLERTASLQGLCGDARNAAKLELGAPVTSYDSCCSSATLNSLDADTRSYTLDPVHALLLSVYDVSVDEQAIFSLELLTTLTAQAARNGFGIKTQSPFKPYYSALLRTCLDGRGSPQHEDLKRRVARALGSDRGGLERGMDRIVEDMVCPEIIALFPLTSRINHACQNYTAQVQSQQFVDCHIDLVAVRDMECGEEITISYIYTGRKNKHRRRRELEAKYLFVCECSHCIDEI